MQHDVAHYTPKIKRMELTLRSGGYHTRKKSHHVVSRQMLQLTSMMPWFVGFLFHMFRSCIAKSQPTPTDSEHLESFWGFGCAWGILLSWDLLLAGTGSSPSRCQQGVLGRTSTDAVRGTTLLPYRGVDTEVREKG